MTDYKDTLNLPKTNFSMKADLAKREPETLAFWEKNCIYQKRLLKHQEHKKFVLHDGPPYANGRIHIGHSLNKILKDIVIKSKALAGFNTPYVPGWDCHGLPIEVNVEKQLGKEKKNLSPQAFIKACREYAESQVEIQRTEFKRLGVLGDWDNPYTTMNFKFEANIIRSLAKIVANGHLLRGSKPVHWCIECGSALAEAEAEYQDKTSLAVDVRFKIVDPQAFLSQMVLNSGIAGKPLMTKGFVGEGERKTGMYSGIPEDFERTFNDQITSQKRFSVPIWTTTLWTLPANEAVALNPNTEYALVECAGEDPETEYLLIAASLVESVMARYQITNYQIVASCLGEALEKLMLKHPYLDKEVPIILGEHVTVDVGTGAVHTAPSHGQDDYVIGSRYGLPINNPVNGQGCFIENTPVFAGKHLRKIEDEMLELLEASGSLLHKEKYQHSYPHCWRHKTPLIFRATPQWFISMEKNGLRTQTLKAIDHVQWSPQWAQARMAEMLLQRPDWCISRQRLWGTPLSIFVHKETYELHPNTLALMEQVAKLVEEKGVVAWHDLSAETLLGEDAKHYEKVNDILDVWFDSGVTHACVLMQRPELAWPADLYFEGSDQYRAWFQTSLLTGVTMEGKSPYKMCISHGFTVDAQGRKMSKSLGNVILPEKIWNTLGAEILRLWAASTDYKAEASISDEILQRTAETYRRIRNTVRFLLSNLFDFDPNEHLLDEDKQLALDTWAISRAQELQKEIQHAYETFQFHIVTQKLHNFCTVDMGSFYLDIIKDRQYTTQKNSRARRSAQTAMYHILEYLVRWLAPILSFTAEEIWQNIPWKTEESIFLTTWYGAPSTTKKSMGKEFWERLIEVRNQVNRELEKSRNAGDIGSGLAAEIDLYCDAPLYEALKKVGDELRFVLITSAATVYPSNKRPESAVATGSDDLWIHVRSSPHEKCARCWHRRVDVGQDLDHPTLCGRCVENVVGEGEKREFA